MVAIDGKKIREARLQLDLSPAELADLLEVTDRTIRNWEGGHTGIRLARLRKIAALTGKPITYFTGEPWPAREARYP
jgi:transcriptional regulator with XRE-family HTH domain